MFMLHRKRRIIKIMSVIKLNFQNFVQEVERKGSPSEAIERAEKMYSLKAHKIWEISSVYALKLYESIYLKFYKSHSQLISTNWYENQLRIFVWAIVCYIYLHDLRLEDLGQRDWAFFSAMFDQKDPRLFEYQCHAICHANKTRSWSEDEEKLLKTIMQNKVHTTKWNEVSKLLFQESAKKYFRTAKQCRQRWNNHLDPSKIKGYWKAEECLLLFNYVRENGKKWATLVKIMKNTRNEHSIKNKFNSILKKHRKLSTCTQENEAYDQIIERIKKSIASQANFEIGDASFDFQEFSDCDLDTGRHKVDQNCHQVTQSFLKKLLNYQHSAPEQQKQSSRQIQCENSSQGASPKVSASVGQKCEAPLSQLPVQERKLETSIKLEEPNTQMQGLPGYGQQKPTFYDPRWLNKQFLFVGNLYQNSPYLFQNPLRNSTQCVGEHKSG